MSAPRLRVMCGLHPGSTIGKVVDRPDGPVWLMESKMFTAVNMSAEELPGWCPECRRAYWLSGARIRVALTSSERILRLEPNGVLQSL